MIAIMLFEKSKASKRLLVQYGFSLPDQVEIFFQNSASGSSKG
jgi:hypothetical protein